MIDYKYIRKPSFVGLLFWYRGDFANTMELDETTAREYVGIKDQREGKGEVEEQLQFDFWGRNIREIRALALPDQHCLEPLMAGGFENPEFEAFKRNYEIRKF
jgi:hypothetical protein